MFDHGAFETLLTDPMGPIAPNLFVQTLPTAAPYLEHPAALHMSALMLPTPAPDLRGQSATNALVLPMPTAAPDVLMLPMAPPYLKGPISPHMLRILRNPVGTKMPPLMPLIVPMPQIVRNPFQAPRADQLALHLGPVARRLHLGLVGWRRASYMAWLGRSAVLRVCASSALLRSGPSVTLSVACDLNAL